MTYDEAKYVLAHRHEYPDDMYHYALEVVESVERQGGGGDDPCTT